MPHQRRGPGQRFPAHRPERSSQYIVPGGPGVRVDSGVYPGYAIPPFYDSLIAKLIVWGETRKDAIARMKRACGSSSSRVSPTTIPFHQQIMQNEVFLQRQPTPPTSSAKCLPPQGRTLMLSKLFVKCPQCSTTHFISFYQHAHYVCSRCGHHSRLDAPTWHQAACATAGRSAELDGNLQSLDPLHFPKYEAEARDAEPPPARGEAVVTGIARSAAAGRPGGHGSPISSWLRWARWSVKR